MLGCDAFKEITLNSCPDNFMITAGLTASTNYGIEFKNKFDRKVFVTNTTDGSGVLTVPVNIEFSLSKDMFHDFSGAWELRLYTVDETGHPVDSVSICSYDYLVLIFEDVQPVPDTNNALITIDCA
jgi:hypothetical protein